MIYLLKLEHEYYDNIADIFGGSDDRTQHIIVTIAEESSYIQSVYRSD